MNLPLFVLSSLSGQKLNWEVSAIEFTLTLQSAGEKTGGGLAKSKTQQISAQRISQAALSFVTKLRRNLNSSSVQQMTKSRGRNSD